MLGLSVLKCCCCQCVRCWRWLLAVHGYRRRLGTVGGRRVSVHSKPSKTCNCCNKKYSNNAHALPICKPCHTPPVLRYLLGTPGPTTYRLTTSRCCAHGWTGVDSMAWPCRPTLLTTLRHLAVGQAACRNCWRHGTVCQQPYRAWRSPASNGAPAQTRCASNMRVASNPCGYTCGGWF